MTSSQKQKGDRAERDVVAHLQAHGFTLARRTKAGGEKDMGDVSGVVDRDGDLWCVQVADRSWRRPSEIEAKAREAAAQAVELGAPLWVLVVKRPQTTDVDRWWAWLPTWALYNDGDDLVEPGWGDLACVTVRAWLLLNAPDVEEQAA